ncbi:unnamed protein product [Phytophthora fragariaefolia]|uniref:Unnamed protein product n=1 Tax=Phytophthora fragariaefolia TaxID=1490495 RepID=A0A9W6TM40_9STRA|nr:unnamed protein product [Phytophthora fragariaefolia]
MREEQKSFLEQQRDVIIQQVLKSIQHSGVLSPVSAKGPSKRAQRGNREKALSPRYRLEQNLHHLVHHSLVDSGLDFPHVRNTRYDTNNRSAMVSEAVKHGGELTKKKQVILSRREVESGDSGHASAFVDEAQDNEKEKEKNLTPTQEQTTSSLSNPRLLTEAMSPLKQRHCKGKKRRHQQNSKAAATIRAQVCSDEDYSKFIDPVDAAFDAIRKKVDMRTLAILDRSKMLLGKVKQHGLLPKDEHTAEGSASFVEKLRRRHGDGEQRADSNSTEKDAVDRTGDDDSTQQQGKQILLEGESKVETYRLDRLENDSGKPCTLSPDDILCDLELLQPPSKAPDNDNEWENELARQILTIYATSIKAKALEKAGSSSPEKQHYDNQHAREGLKTTEDMQRLQSASTLKKGTGRQQSLSTSVSLPVINRLAALKNQQHRTSSSPATVHYSWEPSRLRDDGKVIINMPKVPRPIWFAGTGAVKAVWCALADGFSQLRSQHSAAEKSGSNSTSISVCDHRLCEEVRQLETKKKFAQCITTLESLLVTLVRARGVDELETKLWKQLVVTCNAFASRCIDYKRFPAALQLMKQAEHLIDNSILVDNEMRMELLAYLYDTYAHYYYKRRKPHAGLQYILKAHEIHIKQSSWSHLAKCRLHIANLLSFQIKHAEAMKYMASILEMIEENKLEETTEGGAGRGSAQKLCLAAVCYNNLAVEQLHMREFEAASISSANAQRLAKLCLSYSNRWLSQFQATSDCVALAIATLMEDTNASKGPLADCRALVSAEERRRRINQDV